jgi:exopolysaccharide biosynthesis predicted pyruvyltransferase EpsI
VSDAALVDALRRRVQEEVARVIPRGPIALLDFPDYGNPGDSAIWLGALACFAAIGLEPPVYTSDERTFDEAALRRALPSGTILLTGGGNLGDLWPRHQSFRERVLRGFPRHAIVQLPQSIHFADPAALSSARAAFAAHDNVTLLVRDARSMTAATSDLQCNARLCPDLAFCLPPSTAPSPRPTTALLRLYRTDHESSRDVPTTDATVDWVDDIESPLRTFARGLAERAGRSGITRRMLSSLYTPLARRRLRRGADLLRSARVVATDRLHGHILSLVLGVPHVVLGDRNGKVREFVDAWTASATSMRWASSPADVDRLARELVA